MKIFIEAVGSPVWGPLLPRLREVSTFILGADIDPLAWGLYRVDKGCLVKKYSEAGVWDELIGLCRRWQIDLVFPSVHEGLAGWARLKPELSAEGIHVIISPASTIDTFADKWNTFQFFSQHGIPTPQTSLEQEYPLLKPKQGRGGTGIRTLQPGEIVDMTGYVTQEYLEGQEYSIDALCDQNSEPICIVIRERLAVESGLSIKGRIIEDTEIQQYVEQILKTIPFFGPVDMQCFRTKRGVFFTEVNPRIAGGLSLSMAATGNWFAWVAEIVRGHIVDPKPVRHGLIMMRCFQDIIIDHHELCTTSY